MCDKCLFVHHRNKLNEFHRITPLKERADKFLRKLKCSSHPDSAIIFFCNNHREIICIRCKTEEKHEYCEDDITSIGDIYSAASGVEIDKPLVKQRLEETTCLLDELSRLESILTVHLHDLCLAKTTLLEKQRMVQDKTVRLIESALKRALTKMKIMLDKTDKMIKGSENDSNQILSIFENQFDRFNELLETGTKKEIFIMQTTIQSVILKYGQLFEKFQFPLNACSVKDKPNTDVLLKEINLLKHGIIRENIVMEKVVFDYQQPVCVGNIDIAALNVGTIVGLVSLSSGELILCDKSTHVLIMLSNDYKVMCTLKLKEEPSAMVITDETKITVSLPDASYIENTEIDDKMNLVKGPVKKTKVPCLLISQYGKEIIALVADAVCKCFVTIDTDGNITSQRPIYADKENILQTVHSMVVCPVNETIYIAEKTQGCVGISITDGVLVFNYKDTRIPCITGLSMHPTGNLFIAERDADKIVVIHIADDILAKQTRRVNDIIYVEGLRPIYIAYSPFHHILFVSSPNKLRVFKLI